MDRQVHSLRAIDPVARTAICAECGFVHVRYKKLPTSGDHEWRCDMTCKPSYKGKA